MSPHRYAGVYDELLSPPRRSVEPPYGARYGPRSNVAPPLYPLMAIKTIPPMGAIPLQSDHPPGYRGRYDAPPFEDIPPGVEPPVPGFEPSPFEKTSFGPSGQQERERLPPPNYRDPYRPPPYEGSAGYRDLPIPTIPNEIPVHVADQPPRFRENYRHGHSFRDQAPVPYRDGQPFRDPAPQGPYRDTNFRGGPPFRDGSFRHASFREGNLREHSSHNNFREGNAPFRPPSADPRDPVVSNYLEPNFREGFREDNPANREHLRSSHRSSIRSRGGLRRNPNVDNERHREGRDRYNDNRDPSDKRDRDIERRSVYDKNREGRDDRPREYDRNRDYEKERDHDKTAPDQKVRISPKRSRETRDKKRSESRGRSRDRENRREKKEERVREKSSADRNRDHKEKEKKLKDRKKKKREKEKDTEKKKKRDKKEKKDKEVGKDIKKDQDGEITGTNDEKNEKDLNKLESVKVNMVKTEKSDTEKIIKTDDSSKVDRSDKPLDDLYGEELAEAVDKEIIQNYVKSEGNDGISEVNKNEILNKEDPFDGIELQATADELDLKVDIETTNQSNKEMLAPLPGLSKWEVDEDNSEKTKEPGEITSPEEEDGGKVTSDVIKRAENAIFAKAINSLRPIEIKKISSDRVKLYGDEPPKTSMNNIQITVPVIETEQRSIEINEKKKRYSKTPPPKLSVKERLGGKVEDVRRGRESRVVQSTVERVKSRSKTPKKDQPYRRVTVDRDRGRKHESAGKPESSKGDRRIVSERAKSGEKHCSRSISNNEKKEVDNNRREDKRSNMHVDSNRGPEKIGSVETKNSIIERERKKSTLDEAHFEPDYDETVESDNEIKEEIGKKRERPASPGVSIEIKKPKLESETIKLDLTNVKKKPDSDSESSSGSDYSSSSSSSDARKRKKKKKRNKKKKKRTAASESDSESESSSDDHKKKKKKRKHKKKSAKKKKKSKHK